MLAPEPVRIAFFAVAGVAIAYMVAWGANDVVRRRPSRQFLWQCYRLVSQRTTKRITKSASWTMKMTSRAIARRTQPAKSCCVH